MLRWRQQLWRLALPLSVMQQIVRAFSRVESSLQFLAEAANHR